jgi:hypothetical protein
MRRLKVGDHVREVDGKAVGIIVYIMRDAGLVVVNWPPSRQGIGFHPGDLVKVARNGGERPVGGPGGNGPRGPVMRRVLLSFAMCPSK